MGNKRMQECEKIMKGKVKFYNAPYKQKYIERLIKNGVQSLTISAVRNLFNRIAPHEEKASTDVAFINGDECIDLVLKTSESLRRHYIYKMTGILNDYKRFISANMSGKDGVAPLQNEQFIDNSERNLRDKLTPLCFKEEVFTKPNQLYKYIYKSIGRRNEDEEWITMNDLLIIFLCLRFEGMRAEDIFMLRIDDIAYSPNKKSLMITVPTTKNRDDMKPLKIKIPVTGFLGKILTKLRDTRKISSFRGKGYIYNTILDDNYLFLSPPVNNEQEVKKAINTRYNSVKKKLSDQMMDTEDSDTPLISQSNIVVNGIALRIYNHLRLEEGVTNFAKIYYSNDDMNKYILPIDRYAYKKTGIASLNVDIKLMLEIIDSIFKEKED